MWTAFLKFACGPTDKPSPNGRDFGILLVRLYAGGLMIWLHGWSKAQKIGAETIAFPDPLGIGAELSLYLAEEQDQDIALALTAATKSADLHH